MSLQFSQIMTRKLRPIHRRTPRRASAPRPARAPLPLAPLAVIRLRGSQAEMGGQHAAALRELGGWEQVVDFYAELPERLILHADSYTRPRWIVRKAAARLKDTLLRRIERQRPPAYLARSRAFMEELGLPADHSRYVAVMDVLQNVVGIAGRLGLGPFGRVAADAAVPACSTLMVWDGASADGQLRHARNFDFPGIGVWDRVPAVVFCEPDEGERYGFVTSRGADTPGVTAFNEAGITVTMHTRFHRDVTFDGAAIVDIGHDIARRATTIGEAIAIVRERPSASTWGIAVSSAREHRAVVIEANARTVAVVEPREPDHLSCANRYRHPETRAGQVAASSAWEAHSTGRQGRLEMLVAEHRPAGGMTAEALQRALADRVNPSAPQASRGGGAVVSQPATVKSIVACPEERAIHVSVGPAPTSRGPYVRLDWAWDGPVGGRELERVDAPAPADAAEQAFVHYTEATRLDRQADDWRGALAELERAIALQPDDPSYRFLAGVLQLRTGDYAAAHAHLEAGLASETIPLRRGQLLLWASRAADAAGDLLAAQGHRRELLAMDHNELVEQRTLADREERRRWDPRRRRIQLNVLIADAW